MCTVKKKNLPSKFVGRLEFLAFILAGVFSPSIKTLCVLLIIAGINGLVLIMVRAIQVNTRKKIVPENSMQKLELWAQSFKR